MGECIERKKVLFLSNSRRELVLLLIQPMSFKDRRDKENFHFFDFCINKTYVCIRKRGHFVS